MATAKLEKVERDFLTCAICLEHYTDPITLDCQHSFCRRCINDYIKTRAEARKKKLIPCPCCSQMSRVPDPTRPVEEWAGQLKLGFVIQGLIDTLKTEDGQEVLCNQLVDKMQFFTKSTTTCSVCHQIGETTPGVLWCPECETTLCNRCVKMHQVMNRDHSLLKLEERSKVRRRRKVLCKEHKDEQIKFYCQDCDKALCHSCSVVYHRKCESVVTIESMMPKMKADIVEYQRKLSERRDEEAKLADQRHISIAKIKQDKSSIQEEIRNASQRAVEQIKQKEKRLMDQLDVVTDKRVIQLQADIKKGDIEKQTNRHYGEYIDQALTSDCDMDIYDLLQTLKSGCLDIVKNTQVEGQISSCVFDKYKQNIDQILNTINLGEIRCHVSDPLSTPVLYSTIDGRTVTDKKDPDLHDVTVLDIDNTQTVVVTDTDNNCIKSFCTKRKQVLSTLAVPTPPFGMTHVNGGQVMVTLPRSTQIVTAEVKPSLVLFKTLKTSDTYMSVAYLHLTSMACGANRDCVDILNMEGQVMKSVSTNNNEKLFQFPWNICVTNQGNLLVSDRGMNTVTCLTSDGSVVWIYPTTEDRKLRNPTGIITTSGGDILVADSFASNVIQLSESGQYVRDVLTERDGLSSPEGIYLDNHGSLFVCDHDKIKEFIFM